MINIEIMSLQLSHFPEAAAAGPEIHKSLRWWMTDVHFLFFHLIDWKRRSTLIGHKSDLIRWISGRISTGGIYDFPACYWLK